MPGKAGCCDMLLLPRDTQSSPLLGTSSPGVPWAVITRAVPWPQPESTRDRLKCAVAPLNCPSALYVCVSACGESQLFSREMLNLLS